MKSKPLNLIYGMKDGRLVHITEVDSGLRCGCTCPSCNGRLIARKGSKVVHHFAHHDADVCEHGYETSLHLAAKEIISEAKALWVPAVYLHFKSNKEAELIANAAEIHTDDVKLETRMNDIIPDIVVTAGGRKLIIEIFVTHKVDQEKIDKIKRQGISALEINLSNSDLTEEAVLKELVLGNAQKRWLYNTREEDWRKRFESVSKKRDIVSRGFAQHIDRCPLSKRVWKGKPYANFIDDCLYCDFLISSEEILCTGEERIAHLEDFRLSREERRGKYNLRQEMKKKHLIASGKCPYCGGELKERQGKQGAFWGCATYPHCHFTIDMESYHKIMDLYYHGELNSDSP